MTACHPVPKYTSTITRGSLNRSKRPQAYKLLKHKVQKVLRQAHWKNIEDIVIPDPSKTDNNSNIGFWAYIKHCKTDSIGIPPIKDTHGTLHTDPVGKAEVLNKQFQSAFSTTTPLSLKQACQNISPQAGERHPIMQDIQISKHGIEKLLGNLKPHKAAGPDQIKPIILKELAPSVASMLHIIFQKSLHTGKVPDEWKTADIAPVYKKGNRQVASNYRPISLTCICSKLMEHIVVSSIMSHLENNNILHQRQHGFRRARSCETQLVDFTTHLSQHLENGQQIDAIIMDFASL